MFPLRILTWNVNHRTRRRVIPAALPVGILSLTPDVVVLTEYVEGPDHASLCSVLNAGGLCTRLSTPVQGGHNQVFIACRSMARVGKVTPPERLGHAASNCLHIRLANPSLDLVGIRVPMYTSAFGRHSYWNWFESAIRPLFVRPCVVIGDLNVNPRSPRGPGAEHLRRLVAAGWQLPDPAGRWSYTSAKGVTSRLDHALVSPAVAVRRAEYVPSAHGCLFAGPGKTYLSDHAPLVLDVMCP